MESGKTLIVGLWLALGVLGCTTLGTPPTSLPSPVPSFPFDDKNAKGDHKPKAETLIAYGNFHIQAAHELAHSQAERDNYYDLARKSYQKALEIEPKNVLAYASLARLYVVLDDRERAMRTYERAIELGPREAALYYELGMLHGRHKEWPAAVQHLSKAVGLEPENRLYARSLGFCQARAGHYEEGFTTLARIDGEAVAHYSIARMLHHVKEKDLCRKHLQLALQIQPDLEAAREMLAGLKAEETSKQPASRSGPSGQAAVMSEKEPEAELDADLEKAAALERAGKKQPSRETDR
jgi:tetratricopeptide (TPR) repeat protein